MRQKQSQESVDVLGHVLILSLPVYVVSTSQFQNRPFLHTLWSKTPVKCPGYSWGSGWFLKLTGTL